MFSGMLGLRMGASSPAANAAVRNAVLTMRRSGRPKEMLLTPSVVRTRQRLLIWRIASSVSRAWPCSALTVSVRQSMRMFSCGMPYSAQAWMISPAMRTRSAAVRGMPRSSVVSPTTAAPYFLTMGRMVRSTAGSPFTELTIALPQHRRSAASTASGLPQSICKGRSHTACTSRTKRTSAAFSSISGRPALTSRMSAPASACSIACPCTKA